MHCIYVAFPPWTLQFNHGQLEKALVCIFCSLSQLELVCLLISCQKWIPDVADWNKTTREKLVYTLGQRHSFSGNCIYRKKINNSLSNNTLSFFLPDPAFLLICAQSTISPWVVYFTKEAVWSTWNISAENKSIWSGEECQEFFVFNLKKWGLGWI